MKFFISLLFLLHLSISAWASSSPPVEEYMYTGGLGFEVFSLRIQNLHVWRRTQKLFWEVSKTMDWLLSIGFSGKARFGENMTTRLSIQITPTNNQNELVISLENQYIPVAIEEARGVCYNTKKATCFEKISLDSTKKETVFGDYFGSGAVYDKELQEDSDLKRYDGGDISSEADKNTYKMCPFYPDSFLYKTKEAETADGIEQMQNEVAGTLQSKAEGEDDTHIEQLPSGRGTMTKSYAQEGVALVLKNAMNFKQFNATQSILKHLLNYSSGLRGLYQYSSHLALQQQSLLNKMILNQYVGALKNWGVLVATQTAADNEISGGNTINPNGITPYDPKKDRDFQNFVQELNTNPGDIFWGNLK